MSIKPMYPLLFRQRTASYFFSCLVLIFASHHVSGQANNEIQVYASPTVGNNRTLFELHSNHTFKGLDMLPDPKSARWTGETLEITHGFGKNFEIGFYTFTGFSPEGKYEYLGNQVRPRITVPEKWGWVLGASISAEFGFYRPDENSPFAWQGEIRPILDNHLGALYIAFNPNIAFVFDGSDKGWTIEPQFKSVYTFKEKVGLGFEYYSTLGSFTKVPLFEEQVHLIGPMIDLHPGPDWEINGGFLFGLTTGSSRRIAKLIVGYRIGK